VLIFGTLAILFLLFGYFLPWNSILNTQRVGHRELGALATIVFFFLSLRFILQLIQPILYASQKSALASIYPVISNILGLILIYFFSHTKFPELLTAGFILSILPLLTFFLGSFFYFKKNIEIRPKIEDIDFSITKDILSLGVKFFILQISAVIINSSSSFIIIQLFGPTEVTQYNIAFKYFQVALMFNTILITPLWSAFTQAMAKNDYTWVKRTLKRMNLLALLQSIGVIIMLIFSQWIIKKWIGNGIEVPIGLNIVLAIYMIQYLFLAPYSHYINGTGKLSIAMYLTLFESAGFILLAIFLGKTTLGLAGIVMASCITKLVSMIIEIYQTSLLINKKAYGIWNK